MCEFTVGEVTLALRKFAEGATDYQRDIMTRAAEYLDKLQEMEQARKDGRLLMLPVVGVRVGSKIYTIMDEFDGARYIANPEPVVELCKDGLYLSALGDGKAPYMLIQWDELGKEYFLTREEAEAALEAEKI